MDRHEWTLNPGTDRAGDFSWCKCGALRWRRLDGGRWEYNYPDGYDGCQRSKPNPLRSGTTKEKDDE
jgi:hypothetical protein